MTCDLHLGDCLDPATGLPSLPDLSVDHCIMDPPYSAHVHQAQRRGHIEHEPGTGRASFNQSTSLGFEPLTPDLAQAVADECARLVSRWVLVFCDLEGVDLWRTCLRGALGGGSDKPSIEPVRVGIWVKEGSTPQFTGDRPAVGAEAIVIAHRLGKKRWNGGGRHGVWTHPIMLDHSHKGARVHPTQKPLGLMEALVRDFTDPGDLILDPFAGSATTGVACKRLGRSFVGWEKDATFYERARVRLDSTQEQCVLDLAAPQGTESTKETI